MSPAPAVPDPAPVPDRITVDLAAGPLDTLAHNIAPGTPVVVR